MTWLTEHEEDTGLDEPLLVPKVLTPWLQTGSTACPDVAYNAAAQEVLLYCIDELLINLECDL